MPATTRVRPRLPRLALGILLAALGAALAALPAGVRADPPAAAPPADETAPFAAALARVGLTPATLPIDRDDMNFYGGERYRTHLYDVFMDDPLKIPGYARVLASTLLAGSGSLKNLVLFGSLRTGDGVRRGLLADPLADAEKEAEGPTALRDAVAAVCARGGPPLAPEALEALGKATADVPAAAAREAAFLLRAALEALEWRERAYAAFAPAERKALWAAAVAYASAADDNEPGPDVEERVEKALDRIDFKALAVGATDLALGLDRAAGRLAGTTTEWKGSFRWATPFGDVVIAGAGDDTHPAEPPTLLLLDLGGNDTYRGGAATRSDQNPISLLVDVAGNDTYDSGSAAGPAFGAGVLGYGYLVDLAGDDTYRAQRIAEGAGVLGYGALLDLAGTDRYDAIAAAQGAGIFGVGVLADLAGDDRYHAFQAAQGYGYTKGCGLLLDRAGNDEYVAEDTEIRYPSAQTREHNTSLCQGFGMGKRADFTDGHSLAGGVGLLVDGQGDDRYSCGVFGQGGGYWYGVGLLLDAQGNDRYDGVWYVQAAAAHFAVGVLWEGGGDDRYRATMNMAQGAGHDFSLGFLVDDAGDDTYEAPNLSLGAGNDNGLGIFWDRAGDDTYRSAGISLGRAALTARNGLRDLMRTLGVFVDGGGHDMYNQACAGNGKTWMQPGAGNPPLATEKGVGVDVGE